MTPRGRRGFSVIEALVVLMITGTALLLVFEIGVKGAETGFRMGRRALDAADAEPGLDSLRIIIRGARFGDRPRAFVRPAAGDARGFAADVSLDRAGVCGPAGPIGRLELRLTASQGGDLLTCGRAGERPRVVLDLSPARGRFSYSDDGAVWRNTAGGDRARAASNRKLYVRLTSDDGALDLVEETAPFPAPVVQAVPPPPEVPL